MRLLLDTSFLIDVLRGRNRRKEQLKDLLNAGHTLSTTALNVAEIYVGMRLHEQRETEVLLGQLECHELTGRAARMGGAFVSQWGQRGRTLQLPDALVAAISIENQCVLVTDNRKDFPMPEVQLYPLS